MSEAYQETTNSQRLHRPLKSLVLSMIMLLSIVFVTLPLSASAEGLNGLDSSTGEETVNTGGNNETGGTDGTVADLETTDGADALSNAIDGIGVDEKASKQAKEFVSPYVVTFNKILAILILIVLIVLLSITALDMAFLSIPFLRPLLAPIGEQQGSGGGMGMGMGGFGGGMGMGGGQSSSSSKRQLISDSAMQAYQESRPQQGSGGGMGMGMGGFGGGMGGGQESPKTKNVLILYIKKRTIEMFLIGVCVVLFSTLFFTDWGIVIGGFLLNKLSGQ